tara:strand:- start:99 stop:638 length:540 start_codon:yes stop_codon:yes gene_type:complete
MDASIIKCIPEYISESPTGNTTIEITTSSIASICDTAIAESLTGTLQSNKQAKREEISRNSSKLGKNGLAHTTASGKFGVFPIENSKEELSFYNTVVDALVSYPAEAPQIIPTADNSGVPIMNSAEAISLSDDARHRMEYIYSSVAINPDSSKSQLLLDSEIDAATTQIELDAVIDSRV